MVPAAEEAEKSGDVLKSWSKPGSKDRAACAGVSGDGVKNSHRRRAADPAAPGSQTLQTSHQPRLQDDKTPPASWLQPPALLLKSF